MTAPVSLNFENLAIAGGYDNVFTAIWKSLASFTQLMVDNNFAWLFWLGIGFAVGAAVTAKMRRLEEKTRGRLGGPSFFYLRCEARLIRLAIKYPIFRWLSADLDQDLVSLSDLFHRGHQLPPLPAKSFSDPEKLQHTSEYLRLVLPNLDETNIGEARAAARRYVRRIP